jgi:hypothetical protein
MKLRKTKQQRKTRRQRIYKMKGCSSGGSSDNPFLGKGGYTNTNAINKTIPNTGPVSIGGLGTPFLNPQGLQRGGTCSSCSLPFFKGGSAHRIGCKCSLCKMKGGNQGIPYPNGLVGSPWTPAADGWPGVQGSGNYIPPNTYKTDVQTSIISHGGKRNKTQRKQRGGTLSNFMTQDLVNLGRQFQFGVGSAYNALAGYSSPVNPLPWKGQLNNSSF